MKVKHGWLGSYDFVDDIDEGQESVNTLLSWDMPGRKKSYVRRKFVSTLKQRTL